ncbi:MAG: hypothetical protein LBM59_04085 [Ruminococcus sp.]|jgi:hypothetical protein|nr:hypothetical protein [Ruminococcus sp.]
MGDLVADATFAINFASIDFSSITQTIASGIPVVLPTVIGLIGMKKGLWFVLGLVKGA